MYAEKVKSNSPRLQPHFKASSFPQQLYIRDFPDLVVQHAAELLSHGLTYSTLCSGTEQASFHLKDGKSYN